MKKINVLHLIHSLEIGGAENVVLSFAEHHDRSRYHLEICTFKPGGKLIVRIETSNVKVHCLNSSSSNPHGFLKIFTLLKRGGFDVIHFHNPLPVFWGAPAAICARTRIRILTEHSINYPGRVGKWGLLYSILRNKMDIVIACSEEVKKSHLKGSISDRFIVVHNGVDLDRFSPGEVNSRILKEFDFARSKLIIGNVGNLTPQKGQTVLLDAFKTLLLQGIPVSLIVVGEGKLRPTLELRARELGIDEHVRFLGQRSDVSELLRMMDIVVGSSFREGFPVSLLEAMAVAKPVVATNVGGNEEVVIDGLTGLLVSPGNPEELAFSIRKLLTDKALRIQMGFAARKLVKERFSVQNMVKRTEQIYQDLLRINS